MFSVVNIFLKSIIFFIQMKTISFHINHSCPTFWLTWTALSAAELHWVALKVTPLIFFSLRTAIDTKHIITLFSREKLSATEHCFSMESPPLVVHFHYDKQKPACCTCKSLHGLRVSPLLSALLPASGPTWTWSCCCHWGRISREAIWRAEQQLIGLGTVARQL